MDPVEEQIAVWFREEGLAPDSPKEAQLCLLWRALQLARSRLSSVTRDLETHRSQHLAEMTEVRKSLEQIRIFTEHKDALAQEIQDENDQLKEQLRRLISLQDAQISEVAKMLYQQGLTELIHSSPSEQVAYLLVERASLLETSENPDKLTGDGNAASLLGTEAQVLNNSVRQAEASHLAGQTGSLERECSRLERDLEEGSRRLAMAHSEIRRLTDELESAHLTQRAYEPELQSAQQEVEQLRQEVEKLKKYEMAELRKAKELNDRLDLEIRALRSRVRTLDAEKSSLQQTVVSLREEVKQLESGLQEQLLSVQVQADQATETAAVQVESLQKKVEQLESALQEQQRQLIAAQVQSDRANELAKSRATELMDSNQACEDLQNKLSAHMKCLSEKELEIHSLQQQLDNSHSDLDHLKIRTKENHLQDHKKPCEITLSQLEESFMTELRSESTLKKECLDCEEAMSTLLSTKNECETLKQEICETLKCLDKERRKYHETKEKHKVKLCRAKQKLDDETTWRDEKIKSLERELSLCSHSIAKEKELVISMTVENEKLLSERRRLLQQLNEEEHNKKECNRTASLSKCRVDFLEMENKTLGNKIFHMSNQLAAMERSMHNTQSLHFAEDLKMSNHRQLFTSVPVQTSSVMSPELSDNEDGTHRGHTKQTDVTSSPRCGIAGPSCRSAEIGYLNLSSTQSRPDRSAPLAAVSSSLRS